MRKCDAFADETVDCRRPNECVSQRADRVESLLISAVPKNIGAHLRIEMVELVNEYRRQILTNHSLPRNSGGSKHFAFRLPSLGKIR